VATSLLLSLRDITLTHGGKPLLDGAELTVSEGEAIALVGRNGSGKSTFLKIAAGLLEPDGGERVVTLGKSVRYLPQEPDLSGHATVLDYVLRGLGPIDDEHRARRLLEALGFRGDEAPGPLSGGEKRRAALARVLAPAPDVLLLDEPTNHLDLPAIEWLEEELRAIGAGLVLVSHDRRLLTNLSSATVWLDRGVTRRLSRGFGDFESWRDEVLEQEEVARHKLDRKIVAEEDWVRYGVSGRRKRNQKRLRDLGSLRQTRSNSERTLGKVRFTVAEEATSVSKLVIEAKNLAKSFGEQVIVGDLSLRLVHGARLGLIGPNGSGKTTILNLLTGALKPDAGYVKIGTTLQIVALDQARAALDPKATLQETLTGGRGDTVDVAGESKHVYTYMREFLFKPEQARTPVGVLSGGERGRLMLAKALAQPSNLLVLDEPTNDLDLETLDLLQEMIGDYPGTVLLVSHDRDFLDRTVTSVLAYEGEARWVEYAGGYSDMVAQRGRGVTRKQAPATAMKPPARAVEPPPPAKAPAKRKLTFSQQHALKTLPQRITELQATISRAQKQLDDSNLFQRDPATFQKAAGTLAAAQAELAAAEDEWLTLEMLREEIEGG
jgi:ATP-binding cassette subfamily F protein uup